MESCYHEKLSDEPLRRVCIACGHIWIRRQKIILSNQTFKCFLHRESPESIWIAEDDNLQTTKTYSEDGAVVTIGQPTADNPGCVWGCFVQAKSLTICLDNTKLYVTENEFPPTTHQHMADNLIFEMKNGSEVVFLPPDVAKSVAFMTDDSVNVILGQSYKTARTIVPVEDPSNPFCLRSPSEYKAVLKD